MGACRLLVLREPADGLQRRARPPRWPRPLSSSLSPLLLPLKIQPRSYSGSRRAPGAKLSGEEKGAGSEERGRAKSRATPTQPWPASLAPKARTPSPGRRITEARGCHTNSQRVGRMGWGA